ncbi:hypothetical protein ACFYVL_14250 [Streptomyces sp. NPDC004111]|uniref:hypothetical protein n=1 Tax=Streptomyces sp. NPDC004111 TaxID=3364690 RepID=UPI0036A0BD9F
MAPQTVVRRPLGEVGRRVTVGERIIGVAYSDRELVELLRRSGLEDAEFLVDGDSALIEWRGGAAHDFGWGPGQAGTPRPPHR